VLTTQDGGRRKEGLWSYPLSKFKNKEKRKTKIKINRKEK